METYAGKSALKVNTDVVVLSRDPSAGLVGRKGEVKALINVLRLLS